MSSHLLEDNLHQQRKYILSPVYKLQTSLQNIKQMGFVKISVEDFVNISLEDSVATITIPPMWSSYVQVCHQRLNAIDIDLSDTTLTLIQLPYMSLIQLLYPNLAS